MVRTNENMFRQVKICSDNSKYVLDKSKYVPVNSKVVRTNENMFRTSQNMVRTSQNMFRTTVGVVRITGDPDRPVEGKNCVIFVEPAPRDWTTLNRPGGRTKIGTIRNLWWLEQLLCSLLVVLEKVAVTL